VLNKRHSFTAKHDSRFLWFCDQGGYPKALSISGALGIKWWSSQDKRIKSNMRCKKLWVSLSKHIHTMWPFRSLHGMLLGLWQLPYLHNPDHQYCARQASTLRTINGSRTHLGGTWFNSQSKNLNVHHLFLPLTWHLTTILFHWKAIVSSYEPFMKVNSSTR